MIVKKPIDEINPVVPRPISDEVILVVTQLLVLLVKVATVDRPEEISVRRRVE